MTDVIVKRQTKLIHSTEMKREKWRTGTKSRCNKWLRKSHPFSNDPKKVTCSTCLDRLPKNLVTPNKANKGDVRS